MNYLITKMHESLEVPSHGIPDARTGPQPDMMWRTKAVKEEQLTQVRVDIYRVINHKFKAHIINSRQ